MRSHDSHLATATHRLDDAADRADLAHPFQRKWYIRQIIEHGKAEDVAELDLDEVSRLLEELNLRRICTASERAFWSHVMLRSKGLLTPIRARSLPSLPPCPIRRSSTLPVALRSQNTALGTGFRCASRHHGHPAGQIK